MSIELKVTENVQSFDIKIGDVNIDGEITNKGTGEFQYRTDDYHYDLSAHVLRDIAEKLDELNRVVY